ncbi:MAG TPA: ABC transporter substrate-binding protein [Bacteroidetes bacterium]|nr:ABC transporter substrate-binding protein [Bacteroidota bacterium]HRR09182.1 ABC transporter substrate-binding protein [Rhodothermales bacterium]
MINIIKTFFILLFLLILNGCGKPTSTPQTLPTTWPEMETAAKGKTVRMFMWTGDPFINRYMQEYVVPNVKSAHGIDLQISSGQGNQLVSLLATELEAGKTTSSADIMWINGETFYQLRQLKALFGPFVDRLPNSRYVKMNSPFINTDFQQKVDGFEAPWGNVQMAFIYDTTRVQTPPQNRSQLAAWIKAHPGRFTIDTQFAGLTFLKGLLIDIAGGQTVLNGPFDEAKYQQYSAQLWQYLKDLRPHFWRRGETYPEGVAQLHQLFANREIDFTMSNNDGEVDNKVLQGLFPETARAYVWESGTIQNSHFLGITTHSGQKPAALVVINFLLSPEAQHKKMIPKIWGDGTVLDTQKLPLEKRMMFENIPGRKYAPNRADIQNRALMELAPEYMIRLAADFRKQMIEGKTP